LRRYASHADLRIVHSILPFLSDLSNFAMPDGVIHPVGSSTERSGAGPERPPSSGQAHDLALPTMDAEAAPAALPRKRGPRHFNRTIAGLDTGACCDFSELKSVVGKGLLIDAMNFGV
jgi:hypothetical protein